MRPKFSEPIVYIKNLDDVEFKKDTFAILIGDLIIKLSQFVYSFIFIAFLMIIISMMILFSVLMFNGITLLGVILSCTISCCGLIAIKLFQKKTIYLKKLWNVHTDKKWKTTVYYVLQLSVLIINIIYLLFYLDTIKISPELKFQILLMCIFFYFVVYVYFLIQNISLVFIISIDYFRLKDNFENFNLEIFDSNIYDLGRNYKINGNKFNLEKWKIFDVSKFNIPPSIDEDELDELIKHIKENKTKMHNKTPL